MGNGFFLTAGHCVNEARGFEGHRSSPCPHQLSWSDGGGACNVAVYRYDDGHDFALLRLVEPKQAEDLPLVPIDYRFDWDKERKRPLSLRIFEGHLAARPNLLGEDRQPDLVRRASE